MHLVFKTATYYIYHVCSECKMGSWYDFQSDVRDFCKPFIQDVENILDIEHGQNRENPRSYYEIN